MNRQRSIALFFILTGVGLIACSVWVMFDWSAAYEASRDYAGIVLQTVATNTTLPVLQEEPPFSGSLFGVLIPVIYTAWGTFLIVFGLYSLNKAP